MSPEAQRIAIAEIDGFKLDQWKIEKERGIIGWNRNNLYYVLLPDYLNDLNAMHRVEKILDSNKRIDYLNHLFALNFKGDQKPDSFWGQSTATATQRAEAFLKTFDKWTD